MKSATRDGSLQRRAPGVRQAPPPWEWGGVAFLTVAVLWFLHISWRKWADPVIDSGRELYLPWRLSEGAVLYRDVDANYGPLSHYFNALIFRVTGVGCMHLVWTNLVIYLAILALIYRGLRMGWGRLAAFAGSLVFVVVFSFSQLERIAGYNYLFPYSHETIHGFLLILVLIHLWASWLREPHWWKVASAGFCCGLCVLLKVEIIFAAAIVSAGGLVRAMLEGSSLRHFKGWRLFAVLFFSAFGLPSLIATLVLWRDGGFGLAAAFTWANIGWTGLFVYKNIASDPIQMQFLGLSDIPGNLAAIIIYGGLSVAGIAGLAAICRAMKSRKGFDWRLLLPPALAILASYWLPWLEWGFTFPAGLCMALFIALRDKSPAERPPGAAAAQSASVRWLFLLAAGAFMARMCFNPRIYDYGYYQAALAGVVIVATVFRSLPDLFSLQMSGRVIYLASAGAFLAIGLWTIEERSRQILGLKTVSIGEGADQIYGFSPQVDATSTLFEDARVTLSGRTDCRSLLVVPEGVMLNYLLRKPGAIGAYNFNPYWLNWRDRILDGLEKEPPDYVVLITRDMREYGMNYFGDSPQHGEKIMAWIQGDYQSVWQEGGNPLNMNQKGVMILRKKPGPPP